MNILRSHRQEKLHLDTVAELLQKPSLRTLHIGGLHSSPPPLLLVPPNHLRQLVDPLVLDAVAFPRRQKMRPYRREEWFELKMPSGPLQVSPTSTAVPQSIPEPQLRDKCESLTNNVMI